VTPRLIRLFPVASVLLAMATACVAGAVGPSPTDPHAVTTTTLPPTTTTTLSVEEGLEGYRACLLDLGVSIGEILLDGLGRPRLAMAMEGLDYGDRAVLDALDLCGPALSAGALDLSADARLQGLVAARLEAFAGCVRDRGVVSFPDPISGFDGVGSPFPSGRVPWTDPGLAAAVADCRQHLAGTGAE
jgi:hypothetical protein